MSTKVSWSNRPALNHRKLQVDNRADHYELQNVSLLLILPLLFFYSLLFLPLLCSSFNLYYSFLCFALLLFFTFTSFALLFFYSLLLLPLLCSFLLFFPFLFPRKRSLSSFFFFCPDKRTFFKTKGAPTTRRCTVRKEAETHPKSLSENLMMYLQN